MSFLCKENCFAAIASSLMLKGRTVISHSVNISARIDFLIIESDEYNITQWLFWESGTWIAPYFCGIFQQLHVSLQNKMEEKIGSTIQRTVYLTCWMIC